MDVAAGPAPEDVVIALRERVQTLKEMAEKAVVWYQPLTEYDEAAVAKHLKAGAAAPLAKARELLAALGEWQVESVLGRAARGRRRPGAGHGQGRPAAARGHHRHPGQPGHFPHRVPGRPRAGLETHRRGAYQDRASGLIPVRNETHGAAKPACFAPHHHVHNAEGFVHAVEHACGERGLRLTPIRARVLRLIAEAGKPIKAYELLDWCAPPRAWAPMRRPRCTARWIS